ncbi:anti-sigma factor family protein [Virgibacillus proomii]|uniref:anti-sigma factor family protein n=1 Tax=Virgibacillus proomii TaxID=84407 RepID=UPI001C0FEC5F|nr:zf-HC2 domain-containing protein [Virgibacillus proomii]MBU5267897.1 zf-HC2 domain-containing protein [Virgibacillus proomii]
MNCNKEAVELMHYYLDGEITKEQEKALSHHLENCEVCQKHFHELKRTITLIQSTEQIKAPANFTASVMEKLPAERKRVKYRRWFKAHPVLTAAAIFFIFMLSGLFSLWNQDSQLIVSKQENLVIKGDTVIVPANETVKGDLLVKNGDLIINGTVDGNVTLINGKLIKEPIDEDGLRASVGEINGELEQVDQMFEWVWYSIKEFFQRIFSL